MKQRGGQDDRGSAGSRRAADPRVERLKASKREIHENYSRFPVMDWFRLRSDKKQDKVPGVGFDKHDVLAMILAALSLVLPWVLGAAAVLAALIWLVGRLFGG